MKTPAIGRTAPWMILALLFAGIGVWLAGRVAISVPVGKAELGPPTKPTKVSERLEWPPHSFFDGVQKGTTLQQIRDILEDYDKAGLAPENAALLSPAILEGRQKQWYLETMDAGLGLSVEAREHARRILASLPADGGEWGPVIPPLSPQAPAWVRKRAIAPSQLFRNIPTMKVMGITQRMKSEGKAEDPVDLLSRWRSGPIIHTRVPFVPPPPPPIQLAHAAYLFLFQESQQFPPDEDGIERQVMVLHPAQFKTLLLLDGIPPGLVQRLDASR
ncbi:MAG: hypothetical protein JWO82_2961 [Akkermansiaceae bacterium]|nr:hypothetical protein [Akkermansiaceae bacterium]